MNSETKHRYPRPSFERFIGVVEKFSIDELPDELDDLALGARGQTATDLIGAFRGLALMENAKGSRKVTTKMFRLVGLKGAEQKQMLLELSKPLYRDLYALPLTSSKEEFFNVLRKNSSSEDLASRSSYFTLSFLEYVGYEHSAHWVSMPRDRTPAAERGGSVDPADDDSEPENDASPSDEQTSEGSETGHDSSGQGASGKRRTGKGRAKSAKPKAGAPPKSPPPPPNASAGTSTSPALDPVLDFARLMLKTPWGKGFAEGVAAARGLRYTASAGTDAVVIQRLMEVLSKNE